MSRHSRIAVSALVSISALCLPAFADAHRKSVAMVAPVVPPAAPHIVNYRMAPVSRSQLQRLARSSYPANHFQRAHLLKQKGDLDGALLEFLKAAQENPTQVRAYYEQALIFKDRGYNKMAQSALQQALAIKPDYRDARILMASLYLQTGAVTDAASELLKSLGLNTTPPPQAKSPSLAASDHLGSLNDALNLAKGINSVHESTQGSLLNSEPANKARAGKTTAVNQTPGAKIFSPLAVMNSKSQPSDTRGTISRGQNPTAGSASAAGVSGTATTGGSTERGDSMPVIAQKVPSQAQNLAEQTASPLRALLKGIPGVDPQAKTEATVPAVQNLVSATPAAAEPVAKSPTVNQHAAKPGNGEEQGVHAADIKNPALRKQVEAMERRARQEKAADRGFHWGNLFSWMKNDEQASGQQRLPLTAKADASSPPVASPTVPLPPALDMGPADTGFPSGTSDNGSAKFENKQLKKLMKTAQGERRKHRVAGWMDNVMDKRKSSGTVGAPLDLSELTRGRKKVKGAGGVNPVEMIVRQANAAGARGKTIGLPANFGLPSVMPAPSVNVTETMPDGSPIQITPDITKSRTIISNPGVNPASAGPLPGEKLPPTGVRVEKITRTKGGMSSLSPSPDDSKAVEASAIASPSIPWLPSPVDFTRLFRRAMSWVPLPIFKPFEQPVANPAPKLQCNASGLPVVPSPVLAGGPQSALGVAALPLMPPQSRSVVSSDIPNALPQPSIATSAVPTPQNGATSVPNPALASVLSMLPKELATGLQQVLSPAPVKVNAGADAAAPELRNINIDRPNPIDAPSPVPSLSKKVFENLVSARVSPAQQQAVAPPSVVERGAPDEIVPLTAEAEQVGPEGWQYATVVGAANMAGRNPQVDQTAGPAALQVPPPNPYGNSNQAVAGRTNAPGSRQIALAAPANAAVNHSSIAELPKTSVDSSPQRQATPPRIAPGARPVAQRLAAQGFKFMPPNLSSQQQHFLSSMRKVQPLKARTPQLAPVEPPEDEWAKRMRYLLANGTQNLGPGEAFMFSEESGEGVLFLPNGNTVRRKIATPQDATLVAEKRRPDILAPQQDTQYNLSLLGKIINRSENHAGRPPENGDAAAELSALSVNDLLGRSQGFLGWIKTVFKM